MNEEQVKELFRLMRISNTFAPSTKPFGLFRERTIEEMRELLDAYEYKMFKKQFPNLANGVDDFYLKRDGNTDT